MLESDNGQYFSKSEICFNHKFALFVEGRNNRSGLKSQLELLAGLGFS